ncbi:hypothetical protein L596_023580 [Steinernema carpocapsae]|uniref:Uncharacterized protein n=1 Tax=Steinernema carpocapsae TaxID=34508 RepID=A0A4V5ZZF8_STECR|nr:hypothetical protein L596_023580 [Steinernema carpocapsae]
MINCSFQAPNETCVHKRGRGPFRAIGAQKAAAYKPTKESKDPQGVYWTKISELPYRFNARAMTLAELIAMINPVASIHFNFCVDAGYLISQYPSRLRTCPITIVVGETHKAELRQQVSRHFRNIIIAGAPLPIRFGTHHTKLSIFECERALHVVVSTANLIQEDWTTRPKDFTIAEVRWIRMGTLRFENSSAHISRTRTAPLKAGTRSSTGGIACKMPIFHISRTR